MKFNKILAIGVNPANTKIVEEMAKANPSVQFDYVTAFEITDLNLPNVKLIYMDLYYNTVSTLITEKNRDCFVDDAHNTGWVGFSFWLKAFLESKIEDYDFVIATYPHLQSADWFHKFRSRRPIFCTDSTSAKLESDKIFTKQLLLDLKIPSPSFNILDKNNIIDTLDKTNLPVVVKTNIQAGPLGVLIFKDKSYHTEIKNLISKVEIATLKLDNFIPPLIYTENFIVGSEISVHFLCNGTSWKYIGAARDYKKHLDNDEGLNTSGMGCYSPVDYFTEEIKQQVFSYVDKILAYLNNMAIYYKGFLYLGIIVDNEKIPHILEINTRPGTPEILTILNTVDNSNLLENLYRSALGKDLLDIVPKEGYSVAVGLMNKTYPPLDKPLFKSIPPTLKDIPDNLQLYKHCKVFINHNCHGFLTSTGSTKEIASRNIYEYINSIEMNDFRYRNDIGFLE